MAETIRSPLVYVTGLSGSGKTTVLDSLRPTLAEGELAVDFSSLLSAQLPGDPAGWEELSESQFTSAVEVAAERLVADPPAIAAGHVFALRHNARRIVGAAWDRLLPCAAVVWLAVEPDELTARRPLAHRGYTQLIADQAACLQFLQDRCSATATPLLQFPNNVAPDLRLIVQVCTTLVAEQRIVE